MGQPLELRGLRRGTDRAGGDVDLSRDRPDAAIRCETDGFVSLQAGYAGGTMTTKPFIFTGAELSLNMATSAAGSVRIELRDVVGRPVPGRSLADVDEMVGDAIEQRVTWKGDGDVSAWRAGRSVCISSCAKRISIRCPLCRHSMGRPLR